MVQLQAGQCKHCMHAGMTVRSCQRVVVQAQAQDGLYDRQLAEASESGRTSMGW